MKRLVEFCLVHFILLLMMFPVLWIVILSIKTDADIVAWPPKLLFSPTIENYAALFEGEFLKSFWNSLVTSVSSTVIALVIGVPGAYALSRLGRTTGSNMLSLFILATRMAPPIAFTIPYFLAYRYTGLLDTKLGLTIIYLTINLSLVVWIMRTFFDTVPHTLEEAAWIDGASLRQTFFKVILPLTGPGLAATAILCFLYAWNDFFFALVLSRTEARTAPVAVVNFLNYEGWEWGKVAAGSVMVMTPVLIFSLLVRKYLVSGMTAGAVKG
ncbi:ABC transporter permease subunit [Rhodobacterales bacterium FZCC0188]|jgi:multiple sugar transport system permease protein|nr:ABC transporter permease subunit [Rhodobacterales bacterium FZCC0188]